MIDRPMIPMSRLEDVRPGDIAFGPISGLVGLGVGLGQLALGEGFRIGELSIRHVRVVTQGGSPDRAPRAVEAMPSGAREIILHEGNAWGPAWAYFRLQEDYQGQAVDAAAVAYAMIGTPYSFLSYAALAAWHWGLKLPRLESWIDRRQARTVEAGAWEVHLPCEAICSVLADQAWTLVGKKVMEGVPQQVVTPGALAGRLLRMAQMQTAVMSWPART